MLLQFSCIFANDKFNVDTSKNVCKLAAVFYLPLWTFSLWAYIRNNSFNWNNKICVISFKTTGKTNEFCLAIFLIWYFILFSYQYPFTFSKEKHILTLLRVFVQCFIIVFIYLYCCLFFALLILFFIIEHKYIRRY